MRILATCSLGGAGHWLPLAEFLRAAAGSDDRILVVAPRAMRAHVEASGFRYSPGGQPAESMIRPIRERLPTAPPAEASRLGNHDLFGRLAAAAMHRPVDEAARRWRPDVIVRDPCEYAAAIVAAERAIPSAQIGISLAEVEWGSLSVASPALEEHLCGLTDEIASAPYVTRFPTELDPSPFASTYRYRPPTHPAPEPLPDWWARAQHPVDRSSPLVYVTFGTVFPYLSFAADVYRRVLDALAALPARVLLTVGSSFPIDRLGPTPSNAHVEPWVDQGRVLAEAGVVVCHGGSGTVLGAIEAGRPLVVVPVFSDQHRNAQLVERHRLGTAITAERSGTPIGDRQADALADAVRRLLAGIDRVDAVNTAENPPAAEVLARLVT